ncbi:CDP-glycerol glycerophosphotransferase family protein [Gallibacterium sp. AGMB14963]|uniref:CDP-glycerol glycerophosphotransferase family protein n=1 Tax=Gallibacterium faecale TaxID=3019086 RepID=UPI0022F19280|nr:CDP-glycerol glycerophosphotransferase family protein [Gallibacterium sp. AGMB14963]MDA3978223.1 CDP-glycerol glycerophosphotransferase family protein [Gallibacterium sp. AGMB14963]
MIDIHFFGLEDYNLQYFIGEEEIFPIYRKEISHKWIEKIFINEYRISLSFNNTANGIHNLKIKLPNSNNILFKHGKNEYKKYFPFETYEQEYKDDLWLFMDKDMRADDNAEHLYRYIAHTFPEKNIVFVLSRKSIDWNRLENEGFNLVDFGSMKFERQLQRATVIISSHADNYFLRYFGKQTLDQRKFVFLQHGVIFTNLSTWLNSIDRIDLFVTSTIQEFNDVKNKSNFSTYKFNREVCLTGLPRHDSLLRKSENNNNILIMPTWRQYLAGRMKKNSVEREFNPNFKNSYYCTFWKSLLHNKKLMDLVNKFGYSITLLPHPNILPYINDFSVPNYIYVPDINKAFEIQNYLSKATILITDYSSIQSDIAIQEKAVLYYQFDNIEFFAKHSCTKGYFSYENDGFGPVAYTEEELFKELEIILKNDGNPTEPYITRIRETFPFRDGKNCERVYQAILDLDKPDDGKINLEILRQFLNQAVTHQIWALVESRANLLMIHGDTTDHSFALEQKCIALINQNKLEEIQSLIDILPTNLQPQYRLQVALKKQQWQQTAKLLKHKDNLTQEEVLSLLHCEAELNHIDIFMDLVNRYDSLLVDDDARKLAIFWQSALTEQWANIIEMAGWLDTLSEEWLKEYQPQLLLAKAYRYLEDFDSAHNTLIAFEKHSSGTPNSRIEIAHLAYLRGDLAKVVKQLEQIFNDIAELPSDSLKEYLLALKATRSSKFPMLWEQAATLYPQDTWYLLQQQDWSAARRILATKQSLTTQDYLDWLHCCIELEDYTEFSKMLSQLQQKNITLQENILLTLWQSVAQSNWQKIIAQEAEINNLPQNILQAYHPQLLLAKAYRYLGDFDSANNALIAFEKHSVGSPNSRMEIAYLAHSRGDSAKVIKQLEQACASLNKEFIQMPEKIVEIYLNALYQQRSPKLPSLLYQFEALYAQKEWFQYQTVMFYLEEKRWQDILQYSSTLSEAQKERLVYPIVLATYRLGLFDRLDKTLVLPTFQHNYDYWQLVYEIACMDNNIELQKHCLKGMIAIYPERNKEENLNNLHTLQVVQNADE